ncbi:MAG: hypothetical protein KF729_35050 [Sandaracinaceae bacterium]|nr:hypothetical protein [Sandaracinaceae bacterium]
MTDHWKKTTRVLAALALLGAIIACGGSSDDDGAPITATSEGTAAAQPAGGPPQALALGAAPTSIQVPAPPSFDLTIAAQAEYQIDAMGAPMDAEIFLYRGDDLVESNDDGGEGTNARIVRFLDPGTYSVRIVEHRARAMTAQVQAQQLPELTPVGTLTPGQPLQVQFPNFPILQRPQNDRDAARAVTFTVAAPGTYQCDAAASNGRDAKMAIIRDGLIVAQDDDSGEGNNARITRAFEPGTYSIRVWDWIRRGEMTITVSCTPR